jgi:hypothetical protein
VRGTRWRVHLRPDREALAEAVKSYGRDGHAPDMSIICDDWFLEIADRFDPPFGR